MDFAELLDHYSIEQMLEFYKTKYISDDIGFIVRSLVYFDDAEPQTDPISLKNISWSEVKKKIEAAVKKYVSDQATG